MASLARLSPRYRPSSGGFLSTISFSQKKSFRTSHGPATSAIQQQSGETALTKEPEPLSKDEVRKRMLELLPTYKSIGSQFALKRTHEKPPTEASQDFDVTVAHLMAAGLHFGHTKTKYHCHNLPFIFGERHGQYIINLEQTIGHLRRAVHFLREAAMEGASIVFVGTKGYGEINSEAARRCDSYYVSGRWKPGTFTNGYNVLRRFNPPDIIQVPEDAKRTRQETFMIREPKPSTMVDYAALIEAAQSDYVETAKEKNSIPTDSKGNKHIMSESKFNYLMKTLPDPEIEPSVLEQYKDAKFPKGIDGVKVEKARMILFPDEFESFDDFPDYIRYRFQIGPVDPAADPNYDVEEDLYLTPEQIRRKKEDWIQREKNNASKLTEKVALPHKPDLLICLNPKENMSCLREATMCGIPTIGIIDTDVDPRCVTYAIPGNDDSLRGVQLVANVLSHAILEGKALGEEIRKTELEVAMKEERRVRRMQAVNLEL